MDKIVLIDGNNIAHIVFHSAQNIARKQGVEEDQRFDFLEKMTYHMFFNKIFSFVKLFPGHEFIVAWDSKDSTAWRRNKVGDYKSNRVAGEDVKNSLFKAIDGLKEMMPSFPLYQIYQNGFEADDIIYHIASQAKGQCTVISNDGDLQQIAQRFGSTIYNPRKKKFIEVPEDYDICVYKALVGDSSDNIKGIKGIGAKTGEKIAKEVFSGQSIENLIKEEYISDYYNYLSIIDISLNERLKDLDVDWEDLLNKEKKCDDNKIMSFFKKYNMKAQIGSWAKNKKLFSK